MANMWFFHTQLTTKNETYAAHIAAALLPLCLQFALLIWFGLKNIREEPRHILFAFNYHRAEQVSRQITIKLCSKSSLEKTIVAGRESRLRPGSH